MSSNLGIKGISHYNRHIILDLQVDMEIHFKPQRQSLISSSYSLYKESERERGSAAILNSSNTNLEGCAGVHMKT